MGVTFRAKAAQEEMRLWGMPEIPQGLEIPEGLEPPEMLAPQEIHQQA
jgi:hypothetical protein